MAGQITQSARQSLEHPPTSVTLTGIPQTRPRDPRSKNAPERPLLPSEHLPGTIPPQVQPDGLAHPSQQRSDLTAQHRAHRNQRPQTRPSIARLDLRPKRLADRSHPGSLTHRQTPQLPTTADRHTQSPIQPHITSHAKPSTVRTSTPRTNQTPDDRSIAPCYQKSSSNRRNTIPIPKDTHKLRS